MVAVARAGVIPTSGCRTKGGEEDRLRSSIETLPPLVLVLTRRDGGEVQASVVASLVEEAEQLKLRLARTHVALVAERCDPTEAPVMLIIRNFGRRRMRLPGDAVRSRAPLAS